MYSEEKFYSDSATCLDAFLAHIPVSATYLGDHRFDGELGSYTEESLEERRGSSRKWLEIFERAGAKDWSEDAKIDLKMMIHITRRMLRNLERVRVEYRNPVTPLEMSINGLFLLIQRTNVPVEDRLRNILSRMRQIPRYLGEAREVIVPEEGSPFWAQGALKLAQIGIQILPQWPLAAAGHPELQADLEEAAKAAVEAFSDYLAWLEKDVVPKAHADCAVGKELFDEILREDHMVDYDSDEIHERTWAAWHELTGRMEALGKEIDPSKSLAELFEQAEENFPAPENLIDSYRAKIAEARQFVQDREIATIPEGESTRVEETPPHLRPVVPYGGILVPYFVGGLDEAVFIVTPPPVDKGPEAVAKNMGHHAWPYLTLNSIHEIYPGHRLQLAVGAKKGSLPRQLGRYLSPSPFGGWAYYGEEVMEDEGFLTTPFEKLGRLQLQRERCSLAIADISYHTGRMTLEEARDFLVKRSGLQADNIDFQTSFLLKDPGERQSYYTGYMQIRKLVDDYREVHPEATLLEVNDAILSCGLIPPSLMRESLLGQVAQPV